MKKLKDVNNFNDIYINTATMLKFQIDNVLLITTYICYVTLRVNLISLPPHSPLSILIC